MRYLVLLLTVVLAGHAAAQAPVGVQAPAGVPTVQLSGEHQAQALIGVGATLPELSLPTTDTTEPAPLAKLYGRKGTVVVWYNKLDRQAKTLLRDLTPDVIVPLAPRGIETLVIAVGDEPSTDAVRELGYQGPILRDATGEAFAKVGSESLPRVYVLDAAGKLVWFDIEYSESSRRELGQTLRVLAPKQ